MSEPGRRAEVRHFKPKLLSVPRRSDYDPDTHRRKAVGGRMQGEDTISKSKRERDTSE